MPGVPTLVTYIGYKNEPPVVFDGFFFSFGLRWRYGPMVPVVVNTKTKETIISTAGTCLMILWYYNSTLNICSSVEGWGNSGTGLAVYRGRTWRKTVIAISSFHFQPCIVNSDEC